MKTNLAIPSDAFAFVLSVLIFLIALSTVLALERKEGTGMVFFTI